MSMVTPPTVRGGGVTDRTGNGGRRRYLYNRRRYLNMLLWVSPFFDVLGRYVMYRVSSRVVKFRRFYLGQKAAVAVTNRKKTRRCFFCRREFSVPSCEAQAGVPAIPGTFLVDSLGRRSLPFFFLPGREQRSIWAGYVLTSCVDINFRVQYLSLIAVKASAGALGNTAVVSRVFRRHTTHTNEQCLLISSYIPIYVHLSRPLLCLSDVRCPQETSTCRMILSSPAPRVPPPPPVRGGDAAPDSSSTSTTIRVISFFPRMFYSCVCDGAVPTWTWQASRVQLVVVALA